MSLVQHTGATSAHVLPPDRLRAAVLGRRVSASPEVSRLICELAFGAVYRELTDALPVSSGRARS